MVVLFALTSCVKDEEEISRDELGCAEQTTIMYFMGTSLRSYFLNYNIADSKIAVANGALGSNGRFLIFLPSYSGATLYELYEEDGVCMSETIASFDSKESLDQDRIIEVITKSQEFAPANTYNMIFSGHGTGWVPSDYPSLKSADLSVVNWEKDESAVMTRFMGSSSDGYLEVSELREAL